MIFHFFLLAASSRSVSKGIVNSSTTVMPSFKRKGQREGWDGGRGKREKVKEKETYTSTQFIKTSLVELNQCSE